MSSIVASIACSSRTPSRLMASVNSPLVIDGGNAHGSRLPKRESERADVAWQHGRKVIFSQVADRTSGARLTHQPPGAT